MLQRPSSRLLILDGNQRLLLFKFVHKNGPLAGQSFWATPGGALDTAETFEAAARRELFEETGMKVAELGTEIAQRFASFTLPTGEMVEADERYFIVQSNKTAISDKNWTELEHEIMSAHHWWSQLEIKTTSEQIWPEKIWDMLIDCGAWTATSLASKN
jgi:8-oxo-dGTP diphosphatase